MRVKSFLRKNIGHHLSNGDVHKDICAVFF